MNKTLFLGISIGLVAASASATSTTFVEDTGTAYQTPAISTFNTYGDDMDGMEVFATFSNGKTETAIWNATGINAGGAGVAGFFSISESGDSFQNNAWTLQNLSSTLSITSFTMFGVNGSTTFDRTYGGQIGTTGSALGKDFAIAGLYSVTATYSDELNLTGSGAVGDEWEQLSIGFSPATYFGPHATTTFTQDTDNAAVRGTITRVPEVANTGMLFGISLMALAALKRRLA